MRQGFLDVHRQKKHLNYYLNHDIPVVIILVDTHSKTAYWEVCKVEYINFISDTSWALPIPKRQQINNAQKEKTDAVRLKKHRLRVSL